MNAAIVKLFLRSSGAPKPLIDLVDRLSTGGFTAFRTKAIDPSDPVWDLVNANPNRTHRGLWMRSEGPTNRVTLAFLMEGETDEDFAIVDGFAAAAGGDVLPSGSNVDGEEERQDVHPA